MFCSVLLYFPDIWASNSVLLMGGCSGKLEGKQEAGEGCSMQLQAHCFISSYQGQTAIRPPALQCPLSGSSSDCLADPLRGPRAKPLTSGMSSGNAVPLRGLNWNENLSHDLFPQTVSCPSALKLSEWHQVIQGVILDTSLSCPHSLPNQILTILLLEIS